MANFLKTIGLGYKMLWEDINVKLGFKGPKIANGVGAGLQLIASGLIARTACKDDTRKAIEDANKALREVEESVKDEKKPKKVFKLIKAHIVRDWKVVKKFGKPIGIYAAGEGLRQAGFGWSVNIGETALKGSAATAAAFAAYRANVRAEEGEEADLKYLTGGKPGTKRKSDTDEDDEHGEYVESDDGITIHKDPNAFKFWFSKETCPSLWSDCRDLVLHRLDEKENILTLRKCGPANYVSLNDMRREFGGLAEYAGRMDVDIGGIYGQLKDPNKSVEQQKVNLHHRDDKDFVEGRTDGCWIIYDCEPIIGKIGKKFTSVEV